MEKILEKLFGKKIAIHCRTKEDAEKFIEACKVLNDSNTIDISSWDTNKENTCFDINNKEYVVSFAPKAHYLSYGYEVVSFEPLNSNNETSIPRRNESGQPYGVALTDLGSKYLDIVLGYYTGKARRFNISVERMAKNFKNDFERKPDKYSEAEVHLIEELETFDTQSDEHIVWLSKVFELQHNKEDVVPLVKEVVDELDYVLENEKGGGFLNDETYQTFRQVLIGKLAKVYEEPINFLGAIIRTISLSVGAVIKDYDTEKVA